MAARGGGDRANLPAGVLPWPRPSRRARRASRARRQDVVSRHADQGCSCCTSWEIAAEAEPDVEQPARQLDAGVAHRHVLEAGLKADLEADEAEPVDAVADAGA